MLGFLSVTTCFVSVLCVDSFSESALASSDGPVLLDMPIYNQTSSDDLFGRAESMVSQEINRHFDTNPSLAEIEVVVLGNRNGDILPVLANTVSRSQWQDTPQVDARSKYYQAYALIRRHDSQPPTQVASVAASPRTTVSYSSSGLSTQFERQFDSGRLNSRTVQSYVDFVD